jgi:serine/threonine protein kinase
LKGLSAPERDACWKRLMGSGGRPHADQFDFAWPEMLIADCGGNFLGFRMPLFGKDWVDLELLMQASQAENDFRIGERKRLMILKNLARAVDDLHALGVYCIDLKPKNVRVNLSRMSVGLIDCDGMSIVEIGVENSTRFHADKSTPEFWAPENLGRKPREFVNEEMHDRFALATIIFMLLNRGIHPFQGYLLSDIPGTETTVGKIKHGLYPYLPGNTTIIAHRDSLYPFWAAETKKLFDRAFTSTTERPTAHEWFIHLQQLLSDATPCPTNPAYHVRLPLVGCTTCARNAARQPESPKRSPATPLRRSSAGSGMSRRWLLTGIGSFVFLIVAIRVVLLPGLQETIAAFSKIVSSGVSIAPSIPIGNGREPPAVQTNVASNNSTPSVEFALTNNAPSTLHVAFYEGNTRNKIGPSDNRVYIHSGRATQMYRLNCTTGQLVCYGATKDRTAFNPYWGVDVSGNQSCTGCCITCPGTSMQYLNENDAGHVYQPLPSNVSFDSEVMRLVETHPSFVNPASVDIDGFNVDSTWGTSGSGRPMRSVQEDQTILRPLRPGITEAKTSSEYTTYVNGSARNVYDANHFHFRSKRPFQFG